MFYYIASLALSLFVAFIFWGASKNKLTKSMDDLAAAGLGWVKDTSASVVRFIGVLELAGAAGVLLAPFAYFVLGFDWAKGLGVAAAAGLGLTMIVAAIMHTLRKEIKYTWKLNFGFAALAIVDAVLIALITR